MTVTSTPTLMDEHVWTGKIFNGEWVSAAAFGSFFHQGQICMTTGRHLVHESIADSYTQRLAAAAEKLTIGNPAQQQVDLGPLIDAHQRDKVHGFVTSSIEAGAHLAAGGKYESLYYRPTVLDNVTPGMPAYDNEIFGPVAPVVRFSTLDEVVALANSSEYGLSLGILTKDVMKGLELAERIPSGIVHINDQTVSDEAFTETQWVTLQGQIFPYPM